MNHKLANPAANNDFATHTLEPAEQDALMQVQFQILEMVTNNCADQEVLGALCSMAEKLLPNSVASIMTIQNGSGLLDVLCAPSVPPAGIQKLNGLQPGPSGGSCGNAVFGNQATFVVDAGIDPRCEDTRETFAEFGLCSCWSNPIREADGEAIGSFALSSFEVREPGEFHKQLLAIGANIVGIILQRSKQQLLLKKYASTDPLTGLANRAELLNQINRAIQDEHSTDFALMLLDLDQFKRLNDTFGHSVADEILVMVSKRLQREVSAEDTLARIGGDEFVLLISNQAALDSVLTLAEQLRSVVSEPFMHDGKRLMLEVHIGVALYPSDGEDAEQLLKNAEAAAIQAKVDTSTHVLRYNPELSEQSRYHYTIENNLRSALEQNEFELHYQSQVESGTGRVCGFEALLRWKPSDGSSIGPAEFIPVAEQTGLIVPIGSWVVATALEQAELLFAEFDHPVNISINLSGAQLSSDNIDDLIQVIERSAIPNQRIELEITETFLVSEAEAAAEQLQKLKACGVRLAIDDFGIGYSSLAYLKRFKVNTLKIDRLLINDITHDKDDLSIVIAVVALGHSLGLTVIAEGVETREQAEILYHLNCDILQGYHFSKPTALTALVGNDKRSL